ncbi:hypothetical protein AJ80_05334 [Polytolypa hystricis UAMH7299]|uniref:GPI inositol-deacylase n=1 Tax=Polytolypa hystricis (strain UAMH7299) TaxID=1447883 RepID=A0A2B7Y4Q7_POLH7|nr:hypothetical protein AJ80_05334 [Polytolypa hystricis UAMH7299]
MGARLKQLSLWNRNRRRKAGKPVETLDIKDLTQPTATEDDPPDYQSQEEDGHGPLGLNCLHAASEPLIDFIFVHGLGGCPRKTWAKSESRYHYWPKEWLPNDLEFHRIHCDPDIRRSKTKIVLIAHSMGGIVIKKVCSLPGNDKSRISSRIHTLYFLATPHRGSDLAAVLANILQTSFRQKQFVLELKRNSTLVASINDSFRHVADDVHLWSFYETIPASFIIKNAIFVDEVSATLGYPKERTTPLNADHRGVCKFDQPTDPNYITLRKAFISTIDAISSEVRKAPSQRPEQHQVCIAAVIGVIEPPIDDLAALDDVRLPGLCRWLEAKDVYKSWQSASHDSRPIFWVSGKPGSGKSVISSHVIAHFQERNVKCSYFFFKFGNVTKSTISACLLSLVYQMASADDTVMDKTGSCGTTGPFGAGYLLGPSSKIQPDDTAINLELFIKSRADLLPVSDTEDREELEQAVLGKANGSFLWVSLIMRELEYAYSKEIANEILEDCPQGMEQLYTPMIATVVENKRVTTLALSIFTWALMSLRPLSVAELQCAIKLDIGQTVYDLGKSISDICGQFFHIDSNNLVQCTHDTARTFLITQDEFPQLAINSPQSHSQIAKICLRFLNNSLVEVLGNRMRSKSLPPLTPELEFTAYACSFFSDHVQECTVGESGIQDLLFQFLECNVLHWIEYLAGAGSLHDVVRTATNLKTYAIRNAKHITPSQQDCLIIWANDLAWLIANSGKTLPFHPLCPSESAISPTYSSTHHRLLVTGLADKAWDECIARIDYDTYHPTAISYGSPGEDNHVGPKPILPQKAFQDTTTTDPEKPDISSLCIDVEANLVFCGTHYSSILCFNRSSATPHGVIFKHHYNTLIPYIAYCKRGSLLFAADQDAAEIPVDFAIKALIPKENRTRVLIQGWKSAVLWTTQGEKICDPILFDDECEDQTIVNHPLKGDYFVFAGQSGSRIFSWDTGAELQALLEQTASDAGPSTKDSSQESLQTGMLSEKQTGSCAYQGPPQLIMFLAKATSMSKFPAGLNIWTASSTSITKLHPSPFTVLIST